jgi:hypothetical protein
MVVGLVLIATVLSGGRGIFGQIEALWGRRGARRPEPAATEGSPDHA